MARRCTDAATGLSAPVGIRPGWGGGEQLTAARKNPPSHGSTSVIQAVDRGRPTGRGSSAPARALANGRALTGGCSRCRGIAAGNLPSALRAGESLRPAKNGQTLGRCSSGLNGGPDPAGPSRGSTDQNENCCLRTPRSPRRHRHRHADLRLVRLAGPWIRGLLCGGECKPTKDPVRGRHRVE